MDADELYTKFISNQYLRRNLSTEQLAAYRESIYSFFLTIPYVERFLFHGSSRAIASILWYIIALPIRHITALLRFPQSVTHTAFLLDTVRIIIVLASSIILLKCLDFGVIYHLVRQQGFVKAVSIFALIEQLDRLLAVFGIDANSALLYSCSLLAHRGRLPENQQNLSFEPPILSESSVRSQSKPTIYPQCSCSPQSVQPLKALYMTITDTVIAFIYTILHASLFIVRFAAFSTILNSHNNALVSLAVSKFMKRLKSSCGKRSDEVGLAQSALIDIYDRVISLVQLSLIAIHSLAGSQSSPVSAMRQVLSWAWSLIRSIFGGSGGILPFPPISLHLSQLSAVLTFIVSLFFVDWVRHSFICKFNNFRYTLYADLDTAVQTDGGVVRPRSGMSHFLDPLRVLALSVRSDPTQAMARRIGLSIMPLVVSVIYIVAPIMMQFVRESSWFSLCSRITSLFIIWCITVCFNNRLNLRARERLRMLIRTGQSKSLSRVWTMQSVERFILCSKKVL